MKRLVSFLFIAAMAQMLSAGSLTGGQKLHYQLTIGPIKAGEASIATKAVEYGSEKAFEVTLTAITGKAADKVFSMRDTLTSIMMPDCRPLRFYKHSFENGTEYRESAAFKYSGKQCTMHLEKHKIGIRDRYADTICPGPAYDMVSMIMLAGTLDYNSFKQGERRLYRYVDGVKILDEYLALKGRENLRIGGKSVSCLCFSMWEPQTEKGRTKYNELMRIYVTDDPAHTIAGIDFLMKFGSAKARLIP